MHPLAICRALFLLMLANGAPVVAKKLFGRRLAYPLDAGLMLPDHRPLFGASKTVRGVLVSLLVTAAAAPFVGIEVRTGALVAAGAMAGDLLSSFVKRRLGFAASSRAVALDQLPESLLPLFAGRAVLGLSAVDIALAVAVFFGGEIVLSRLLYKAHLRDEPY
jgi:CDP-diglyceride synthetase